MEEVKICSRCAYFFENSIQPDICDYYTVKRLDIVSGRLKEEGRVYAEIERGEGEGKCGPEGRNFKQASFRQMFWRFPSMHPGYVIIGTCLLGAAIMAVAIVVALNRKGLL